MTTILAPQPLDEDVLPSARAVRTPLRIRTLLRPLVATTSVLPQLAAATGTAVVVAVATSSVPLWSAMAIAQLALVIALTSRSALRPGTLDLARLLHAAPLALVAPPACAALTGAPQADQWRLLGVTSAGLAALGLAELALRCASGPPRVLLVGEPTVVEAVGATWRQRSDLLLVDTVAVHGEEADGGSHETEEGPPRAGGVFDASSVAARVNLSGAELVLVIPGRHVDGSVVERLCWSLERSSTRLAVLDPGLEGIGAHRVHAARLAGVTLAGLTPSRPSTPTRVVKAVMDRVLAAVLLVALAPLLALLVLLVRLDSPGPAIFRQVRTGRNGVPFTMLKLRTMYVGNEDPRALGLAGDAGNSVLFKMRRDPRVTRVGRILRSLSLDELPQVVNVLRGEMSLVGPRPALPVEVAAYDERARRRLAVRPGLTGLWQIRGRSELDWDESVALDLHYTDNITLGRDLAICAATVRAVLSRKGAY